MALISWEEEGHWGLTCEEGDVLLQIYNHKTLNSNPTEISAEWASNWV